MANLSNIITIPKRIADIYNKLYKETSKLHKTSASIGFIKKALYHQVCPKFAQIKAQYINKEDQEQAERKLMLQHLNKHIVDMKNAIELFRRISKELYQTVG